jgi:hypothetical protein
MENNPPLLLEVIAAPVSHSRSYHNVTILIYKNYAKLTNFCKKITILLIIRRLHDSELVEIPKGSPLVAVDEKSPLYPRTAFKHKCPGSTLRNLKVMLVLSPGKPYRFSHVKEVMPGVEDSLNITLADILLDNRFPVFPYHHVLIWGQVWNYGLHIPVVPLQDNAQKVCAMVVKKPVVVTPQPVMDSDGVSEEDERPSY